MDKIGDLGISASQARTRKAIADFNATPLSRFPAHLIEIIDFATLAGFADGFEAGLREAAAGRRRAS